MKNKYFYPIYKLKIKSWIKYWLIKQTEFKGVLSDILEGISFYLTDSLNMKFKMFKIYGRTTQEGDPTPENPVPIKNTGDNGSVNEKISNKNIFDKDNVSSNTYLGPNNVSLARTEAIASDYIPVNDINFVLTAKNTYTSTNYYVVNQYNGNKEFISGNEYTLTANFDLFKSLTLNSSCKYVKLSFRYYDTYISEAQLEKGSTATSYVPHSEQNISFPLAQGQKLYEGEELKEDGKDDIWGEYVFRGDESWAFWNFTSDTYIGATLANVVPYDYSTGSDVRGLCTHFSVRVNGGNDRETMGLRQLGDYSNIYICIKKDRLQSEDLAGIKAYIAEQYANGTPIKLVFKKANPTITPYTEEQQTAWQEWKKARTYKNVTHISSEDETPALLKIQYWKEV